MKLIIRPMRIQTYTVPHIHRSSILSSEMLIATLQRLKELNAETITTPPRVQKLDRKQTLEKEHKDALERAVSLNIPHAEQECSGKSEEGGSSRDKNVETHEDDIKHTSEKHKPFQKNAKTNWDEVVGKLFERDESGKLLLRKNDSGAENS